MNAPSSFSRLDELRKLRKPIALFLTYQRTTFTDAFRLATLLKRNGTYEPVFLVARGTAGLLEREILKSRASGIACVTEEEILAADRERAIRAFRPPVASQHAPTKGPPAWRSSFAAVGSAVGAAVGAAVAAAGAIAETREHARERYAATVRYFANLKRSAKVARSGLTFFADATLIPQHGGSVVVTWDASGEKISNCEVYLTDATRENYLAWTGKSGAATMLVLSNTMAVLKCFDGTGTEVATAPPLFIEVEVPKPMKEVRGPKKAVPAVVETVRLTPTDASRARSLMNRLRLSYKPWFGWYQEIIRSRLSYLRVLRAISPAVVCLSEDIPGPLTATFIQAAKLCRIPSIIVPFTIPNLLEVLEYSVNNPIGNFESTEHARLAAAFPKWITTYKGKRMFRVDPQLVLASEMTGIAAPQPFVLNSGYADRILVESERMLKIYRDYKLPTEQLLLTGSAADDLLHEALQNRIELREALYQRLGLPPNRPLLLSALVPDQLVSGVPFCEFKSYPEIVEFWARTIAEHKDKFNVVLKIGPRDRLEDFIYLEKHGLKVAPDDTVTLVPLADVYVASISSTMRWAAACGIPCINFDVYHFRYGDYEQAAGILHVEKKQDLVETLSRLANDDAYRAEVASLQRAGAFQWGRLDGGATERIVRTFDSLRAEVGKGRPVVLTRARFAAEPAMGTEPATVLAVVQLKTQLNELLMASAILRDSGRYRVVFHLDVDSDELAGEMRGECARHNFEVVADSSTEDTAPYWLKFTLRRLLRTWFYQRVADALFDHSLKGMLARRIVGWRGPVVDTYEEFGNFNLCWSNELQRAAQTTSLLLSNKPALVLVGEDGTGGNSAIAVVAKEYGIRTLIVPYEFSKLKQIEQSVGSRFPYRPDSPFDRILASRHAKWLHTTPDGRAIFRMPSLIALAREFQNQSVRDPWTVHGGYADKIAVESDEMHRHYVAEGLPRRKLHYTGALAADEMHRTMTSIPEARRAFETGKKIRPGSISILCAIPPDYLNYPSVRCDFSSFRELLDFWIDTVLSVPNVEATFQCHPAMTKVHVDYLRSRVLVSEESIASLIPRCDFLVTSVSSIIRLAIVCRKPVVNYDVYGFAYTDYDEAPGVLQTAYKDEFVSTVRSLAGDEARYSAAVADQIKRAEAWGAVDGRSGERFVSLVDSMTR